MTRSVIVPKMQTLRDAKRPLVTRSVTYGAAGAISCIRRRRLKAPQGPYSEALPRL